MSRFVRPKKTPQIQLPSNFLGIPKKPLWAPAEPKKKSLKNVGKKIGSAVKLKTGGRRFTREIRVPAELPKKPTKKKKDFLPENELNDLKTELKGIVNSYAKSSQSSAKKEYMKKLWEDFKDQEKSWKGFLRKAHGQCDPHHAQHAADAYHTVVHCNRLEIPKIENIADKIKNFENEWNAHYNSQRHKGYLKAVETIKTEVIQEKIIELWPETDKETIKAWIQKLHLANAKKAKTWRQIFSGNEEEMKKFFAYLWKYEWHKNDFSKLYKDLKGAKIISSNSFGYKLDIKDFWAKFFKKVEELTQTVKVKTAEAGNKNKAKAAKKKAENLLKSFSKLLKISKAHKEAKNIMEEAKNIMAIKLNRKIKREKKK